MENWKCLYMMYMYSVHIYILKQIRISNPTSIPTYTQLIVGLYSVKYHDIHHRLPETNYSQYTMCWDHVWNTFRPYNTSIGFIGKDGSKTSCVNDQ